MTVKRNAVLANFEARSVALIASWTLAGAAMAQNMPAPRPAEDKTGSRLFIRADRNGDGRISREEAAAIPGLAEAFDRLDTDGSGSLSAEAFAKAGKG